MALDDSAANTGHVGMAMVAGAGIGLTVGALIGGPAIAAGIVVGAGVGVVIGAAIDAPITMRRSPLVHLRSGNATVDAIGTDEGRP